MFRLLSSLPGPPWACRARRGPVEAAAGPVEAAVGLSRPPWACRGRRGLAETTGAGHIPGMASPKSDAARRLPAPDAIDSWIFDLDNTLYANTPGMSAGTNRLMGAFVADFLSVDAEEAGRNHKTYFRL